VDGIKWIHETRQREESKRDIMVPAELSSERSKAVEARLTRFLRVPLSLTFTDNTRSMISVKYKDQGYRVRLHHMFLDADESVLKSLADYISGNLSRVKKRLKAFIKTHEGKIRRAAGSPRKRRSVIRPRGRYFHLQEAFDGLNRQYFGGGADCAVTWGNRRKRSGRRSVRLGSYSRAQNIIRINPLLDRAFVPPYVVEDVLYHEMVHHHLGAEKRNGRRLYHHEDFRNMEEKFIHRDKARHWLKENLSRLLAP
jgi:predicted SprT family Zn-dependent metalloprotease